MTKDDVIERALRERRRDCFALAPALYTHDDDAIHRFRLACKRLRFAIEGFEVESLAHAAEALSDITGELGSAHDCVVLSERARRCDAGAVAWHAMQDRGRYVKRARALWQQLVPELTKADA
jgi:CHAD domain-containing protein